MVQIEIQSELLSFLASEKEILDFISLETPEQRSASPKY